MQASIDKIGYGDRDISAGIDVFWLPAPGRKTILISPEAQARLIARLVSNELPFSKNSLETLKEIMTLKKTNHGILYGKTGTMVDDDGRYIMGWFVGYVEHNGKIHAFASTLKGAGMMGKDARALVEIILEKQELL